MESAFYISLVSVFISIGSIIIALLRHSTMKSNNSVNIFLNLEKKYESVEMREAMRLLTKIYTDKYPLDKWSEYMKYRDENKDKIDKIKKSLSEGAKIIYTDNEEKDYIKKVLYADKLDNARWTVKYYYRTLAVLKERNYIDDKLFNLIIEKKGCCTYLCIIKNMEIYFNENFKISSFETIEEFYKNKIANCDSNPSYCCKLDINNIAINKNKLYQTTKHDEIVISEQSEMDS